MAKLRNILTLALTGSFCVIGMAICVMAPVVARSGAIDLVEGQMQVTGVTLIEHERRSKSRGAAMAIGARAGFQPALDGLQHAIRSAIMPS